MGSPGFSASRRCVAKIKKAWSRPSSPQLSLLYGPEAGQPIKVYYQDWATEEFTATEYDQRSAHNHPEFHPPAGKTSIWNGTFHFAGTETADQLGGYLEGALASAERAVLAAT